MLTKTPLQHPGLGPSTDLLHWKERVMGTGGSIRISVGLAT